MNVLSLFDGISTGRLALDMAGIRVDRYFSSEVEPAPMAVSAKHWPDVEQVGDCRQVKAADLPRIDLVIGGSPCQGFSRAGRHLNFDDPRSALFFEYARVLAEVRAINPAARFLLENVAMKKEWEAVITETLGVSPIHINSAKVSAQNRQRVYWTDIPGVKQPPERNIKLADVIDRSVNTAQYVAGGGYSIRPYDPGAGAGACHQGRRQGADPPGNKGGLYCGGGRRRRKPGLSDLYHQTRQGHKGEKQCPGLFV